VILQQFHFDYNLIPILKTMEESRSNLNRR